MAVFASDGDIFIRISQRGFDQLHIQLEERLAAGRSGEAAIAPGEKAGELRAGGADEDGHAADFDGDFRHRLAGGRFQRKDTFQSIAARPERPAETAPGRRVARRGTCQAAGGARQVGKIDLRFSRGGAGVVDDQPAGAARGGESMADSGRCARQDEAIDASARAYRGGRLTTSGGHAHIDVIGTVVNFRRRRTGACRICNIDSGIGGYDGSAVETRCGQG